MDIYDFTDEKSRDIIVLDKNNPPLSKNEIINAAVKKTLENIEVDDLQSSYKKMHETEDINFLTGHCFVATEVLWELLKEQNINDYTPNHIQHEEVSHWYLRHKMNGDIIDVTAGQFKTSVPYHRKGKASGMMRMPEIPTKRTIKVLDRIKKKLQNERSNLKDQEIQIGDWVRVLIVGVNDFNEPPYMVESIDGEDYTVVQKEKIYKHRMKVKKEKLRKL